MHPVKNGEITRGSQGSSGSSTTKTQKDNSATNTGGTGSKVSTNNGSSAANTGNNPGNDRAYSQQRTTPTEKIDRRTQNGHPIVIDLDSDGVEISTLGGSTARFDFDNDGFKELTSWAGKDDGLLVYDLGGDGKVSEAKEIAFAEWTADATDTDLDALKTFAALIASRNQSSCKESHGPYHRA